MNGQNRQRHLALSLARMVAVSLMVVACGVLAHPQPASASVASEEQQFFDLTNQARAGLPALQYDPAASSVARTWADWMAANQVLQHNPNLAANVNQYVTTQWTRLGENIGYGPSPESIQTAFLNSPPHRANILGDFNRVGVGVSHSGGTIWVVLDFVKGPSLGSTLPPPPPPPPPPVQWLLRNAASSGSPNISFPYGMANDIRLSCDWNGDGTDTPGVFRNGQWLLRNSNAPGSPDIVFNYGIAGYTPVCGDWDGNGTETIGIYTGGLWLLRNSNTPGPPDMVFAYGAAGYQPIVGDWNGDGTDTIGIFVNGTWALRDANSSGPPSSVFNYGIAGYRPVTGDWDGSGTDTIGVYVGGTWVLRNNNSPGPGSVFAYGTAGYQPVTGDWNGDKVDSIGVMA